MKILFIGGNGNISWWCVQKALEFGYEVYELNRGITRATRRTVQSEVRQIIADVRDSQEVLRALNNESFDVVCDFLCFNGNQAHQAIDLFSNRTNQYIVISSEAVYQRKSKFLPFVESTPQYGLNVDDPYIAGKIQVERVFLEAYEKHGFPVTIVRPGYTYDTIIQVPIGRNCFTAPQRLLDGYPFLMPGDGENLCAPLHSKDFASAFVRLMGRSDTIGESYQIAAEELITCNEMAIELMKALGIEKRRILHIPREEALEITSLQSKVINEQHMWHYIFDCSKIREIAPDWKQRISFDDGIRMTVDWLMESNVRRRLNTELDEQLGQIYRKYWREGRSE